MKKVLFLLLINISLSAAGFWTLTGLQKANIYVKNDVDTLKIETIKSVKQKMGKMLTSNGIKMKQQDSPTLMIAMEESEDDENHYVYLYLALGEEVQTFRADKSKTFSFSYFGADFIETDTQELDIAVLESVDFLLAQFAEHFEEDNE